LCLANNLKTREHPVAYSYQRDLEGRRPLLYSLVLEKQTDRHA
jgi:hypothetical protein